jgi:hypothetical protein
VKKIGLSKILWACIIWATVQFSEGEIPKSPGFSHVVNLSGKNSDVLNEKAKAIVLIFLSVDCPISNSYAPEFARLKNDFSNKETIFKVVYPNNEETDSEVREHLKTYAIEMEALRDRKHELVKASGVTVTPEAAIFVPGKGFVFHGRIDDRYQALGRARPEATRKELREALKAILNGEDCDPGQKAVGCYISRSE